MRFGSLALALVALAAAAVAAVGPGDDMRTTYSWPPDELPDASPARVWYTPLLLIRHQPEALSAGIPCSLPPPLPAAERPLTVLATARDPSAVGGLAVTRAGDRLVLRIGTLVLARVRVSDDGGGECAYRLRVEDGEWSLEGGLDNIALGGSLDAMPVVTGLLSGLDLRSGAPPSIEVTTSVHATETTARQTVGWILAALALASALILVAARRRPRRPRVPAQLHLADAAVALGLLAWWVIAPVIWDDGWVVARERTYAESGGFSTYYSAFGINLPLDFWLEWLQHWVTQETSVVLLLRFPALLCLAATWVLCRYIFGRLQPQASRPGRADVALWTLTTAFLVLAFSWGMTLRPEPVTALLVTGMLACAVRFAERETVAPVAVAAVLVPLALTAHHTGVVALAPVVAVSPRLLRWARSRLVVSAAIVVASGALLLVLATVGSDLWQRIADARETRESGITTPWRNELLRYVLLADFPWGTPLRRVSVALLALAVLAFLVWRRRNGRGLLDLPATALAVSLVLLIATPSKIPWHFGVLIGLGAVAIAAEAARIRADGATAGGWRFRPFLVIGAAIFAAAWSWSPRHQWNPVDLRTLGWDPGFDDLLPHYSTIAIALPAIVLAGALLYGLVRGRRGDRWKIPWRVAAWVTPVVAIPLLAFTAGMLVGDTKRTNGWTLTRQNLESIAGDAGCGLAADTQPAIPSTARPLVPVKTSDRQPPPAWVPPAPAAGVPRFVLPADSAGSASTPWFRLAAGDGVGLFVAGPSGVSDRLQLDWGRQEEGRIESLGSGDLGAVVENIDTDPWTFIAASELPAPTEGADAVRVTLRTGRVPDAPIAVTAPVTYETERLDGRLAGRSALVHPNLLLYFPCARQPRLADGIVEAPHVVVWFDHPFEPHPYDHTSPFLGVRDLYEVERLPITDGESPPAGVVVFEVDTSLSGGVEARPDAS